MKTPPAPAAFQHDKHANSPTSLWLLSGYLKWGQLLDTSDTVMVVSTVRYGNTKGVSDELGHPEWRTQLQGHTHPWKWHQWEVELNPGLGPQAATVSAQLRHNKAPSVTCSHCSCTQNSWCSDSRRREETRQRWLLFQSHQHRTTSHQVHLPSSTHPHTEPLKELCSVIMI